MRPLRRLFITGLTTFHREGESPGVTRRSHYRRLFLDVHQYSSLSMNSIRRGAPIPVAPVLMTLVIFPKLAEGFPPLKEPRLLPGFLYIG